jgi:excinuclease ABC subunit C
MGQRIHEPLHSAPFSGFGPSSFWPFRRRLQALDVTHDFAQVRRSMREECPSQPGVYGMIDARDQLIYVGMSIVLPRRLVTYFQSSPNERKEYRIASHTNRLVWEVIGHGLAAELRELELIRHHQPRFNVRGKRAGKALGYIFISREEAPRLRIAKQVPRGVRYSWGPTVINWRTREAVETANRHFRLRDCRADTAMHYADQHSLFALDLRVECIRGETASCLGPCAGLCTRTQYTAQLRAVRAFLDGRDRAPVEQLEDELREIVANQQFERAAGIRDRLVRLGYLWDRFAVLREPPLAEQFVYPTQIGKRRMWFLVAGSRVAGVVREPSKGTRAAKTLERLNEVYRPVPEKLASDRMVTQILAGWFRSRPEELQATMTPGEAIEICRRACA